MNLFGSKWWLGSCHHSTRIIDYPVSNPHKVLTLNLARQNGASPYLKAHARTIPHGVIRASESLVARIKQRLFHIVLHVLGKKGRTSNIKRAGRKKKHPLPELPGLPGLVLLSRAVCQRQKRAEGVAPFRLPRALLTGSAVNFARIYHAQTGQ